MAVAIRDRREPAAAGAAEAAFRVIWLGERPWWLDDPGARAELDGIEPGPPVPGRAPRPLVVHARASVLHTLRRASHERLVADISGPTRLDRRPRAHRTLRPGRARRRSRSAAGAPLRQLVRPGRFCECRSTWRSTRRRASCADDATPR